jgi:hypothetical protein
VDLGVDAVVGGDPKQRLELTLLDLDRVDIPR